MDSEREVAGSNVQAIEESIALLANYQKVISDGNIDADMTQALFNGLVATQNNIMVMILSDILKQVEGMGNVLKEYQGQMEGQDKGA